MVDMSYSLNSLKGDYIGDYIWDYYRVIKGDTRSLDYGSYGCGVLLCQCESLCIGSCYNKWCKFEYLRWTPHPVIGTRREHVYIASITLIPPLILTPTPYY